MIPVCLHQTVNVPLHQSLTIQIHLRWQIVDTSQIHNHDGPANSLGDDVQVVELHVVVRNGLAGFSTQSLKKRRLHILFSQDSNALGT